MKHLITLWALLCHLSVIAQSPTQTIKGRVVDGDTRQPLIGATVVVETAPGQPGTVTDFNGDFELPGIPVGRHRIAFQYLGYEPHVVDWVFATQSSIVPVLSFQIDF